MNTLKESIASLAASRKSSALGGSVARFNSLSLKVVASNPHTETLWVTMEYLPGFWTSHDRRWIDDDVVGAFIRFNPCI